MNENEKKISEEINNNDKSETLRDEELAAISGGNDGTGKKYPGMVECPACLKPHGVQNVYGKLFIYCGKVNRTIDWKTIAAHNNLDPSLSK